MNRNSSWPYDPNCPKQGRQVLLISGREGMFGERGVSMNFPRVGFPKLSLSLSLLSSSIVLPKQYTIVCRVSSTQRGSAFFFEPPTEPACFIDRRRQFHFFPRSIPRERATVKIRLDFHRSAPFPVVKAKGEILGGVLSSCPPLSA